MVVALNVGFGLGVCAALGAGVGVGWDSWTGWEEGTSGVEGTADWTCVGTLDLDFLSFFLFSFFSVSGAVTGTDIEGAGVGVGCDAVAASDAAG